MKLLVVVDMQIDFISGALGTPEAQSILPRVRDEIAARRQDGWEILFTRDTHEENYLQTREGRNLPVPHCIRGSRGWEIDFTLPVLDAKVIDKPTFGSTELAAYARSLPDLEEIELIGLCTDICVISNAMLLKAALPETRISVREICCAGVTPESHLNALSAMKMCQIEIV